MVFTRVMYGKSTVLTHSTTEVKVYFPPESPPRSATKIRHHDPPPRYSTVIRFYGIETWNEDKAATFQVVLSK